MDDQNQNPNPADPSGGMGAPVGGTQMPGDMPAGGVGEQPATPGVGMPGGQPADPSQTPGGGMGMPTPPPMGDPSTPPAGGVGDPNQGGMPQQS